jgi:hypothetical protein
VVTAVALLARPPIPQIQSYNDFADQHTILGIPNFYDVVSNVPFLIVGVLGLYAISKAFELLDANVLALGGIVSGHTLKHLAAAAATYYVLWTLERRQPLSTIQ